MMVCCACSPNCLATCLIDFSQNLSFCCNHFSTVLVICSNSIGSVFGNCCWSSSLSGSGSFLMFICSFDKRACFRLWSECMYILRCCILSLDLLLSATFLALIWVLEKGIRLCI